MTSLDSPTAAQLSDAKRLLLERRLRGAVERTASERQQARVIPSRPAGAEPPLSYAQERLWFMEQFAPGTSAYGVPLLMRLGADADLAALGRALAELTGRHESLRMRFPAAQDGRPSVVIDPPAPVQAPVIDVPDEAVGQAVIQAAAVRPFDLAAGPLLRASVVRVAGGADHILLLDMHHIVTDGWSNDIILADLGHRYLADRRDESLAPRPPPTQYGDFARWQREQLAAPATATRLKYWLDRLAGVPALDLPTDRPRPATQTFSGASHWFTLQADLVAGLTTLGRAHNATLFMTLLAGYQVALSRYSGQRCFAIGSPVAGRSLPELDGAVGMFVNMLPLRADLTGDEPVGDLIERVRDGVLDALAHAEVPFEKVVNDLGVPRDVSRPALFQAMLVLQNYELAEGAASIDAELPWSPVELPATRFDLELHAFGLAGGGLRCRFIYNTALFEPATAERLAGILTTLLTDMSGQPQATVGNLAVLDEREAAVLAGWNDTTTSAGDGRTLPDLFERQAGLTPSAVAVASEEGTLRYAELDRAADQIAGRLLAAGVAAESVVAVLAERSPGLVAALLGVIKAGAAYLPLDPEYPAGRLEFMLTDSRAQVVLTQRHLQNLLPQAGPPVLLLDDAPGWAHSAAAAGGGRPGGRGDSAAYLIYTSGSTGRPKGVINTHRGLANRLEWMRSMLVVGPGDVVLQKTPASFDVSVWEFFLPLVTGATLALARPGGHRDPGYLREAIESFGVTVLHFVPSMLNSFLADPSGAEGGGCASVRHVVCSGEELPAALARDCLAALPWASLHNFYGPTEAAIDVTAWRATPASLAGRPRVPIGGPVSNVRMYVLDDQLRQVPVGVVGELYIGGVQVARGYHGRPGLTAQRFRPDPFGPAGSRLYTTGDHGRWRPDGSIEFLGRIDGQVKLRGMRIELGEIEVALRDQPGVRDAAVAVKESGPGDKRLVGYIVGPSETGPTETGTGEPDVAALRAALKRRLPEYMVPATFVPLDCLPLTPSGKLDRAALPAPGPASALGGARTPPRTATERAVAAIWQDVLAVPEIGVDDDFFALGGHSLLATVVIAKLRKVTENSGRRVGVMDLFKHPTIAELAALIDDESAAAGPLTLLHELTKPVPPGQRLCSYVCVPYGGGSAIVYQPIADLLPAGHSLYAVEIPGHDVGLDEQAMPIGELAALCSAEILRRVEGPLVLYGHCGIGGALSTELARQLEAAGRDVDAVYLGGVFPFATPPGALTRLRIRFTDLSSNRNQANWLRSMGVGMDEIDADQADRIISNMRRDGKSAEAFFTALFATSPNPLKAPIICVVGERDPITDYYQERYREWLHIADTVALVVLDEAGHFFLRYRAGEMVQIITRTHLNLGEPSGLASVARREDGTFDAPGGERDKKRMARFALVSFGQLVSIIGSQLTGWAIPVWLYLTTHSLLWFGLSGASVVVPILIATPLAGAVADRFDRRRVIIVASIAAAAVEAGFAIALWTGHSLLGLVYVLVWLLASAGTFQRIAFTSAVPQLVPKRYLGHANGVVQLINGVALLFIPLLAAGLLAVIGLKGILAIDIGSYAFALGVLAFTKFPDLMGHRRRETFRELLVGGARLSTRTPAFRAMLIFYAIGNLFYSVPVLLVTPLVLAFGNLSQVGQTAFAEGLGAAAGGAAMTLWGGPRKRRMVVNIAAIAVSGLFVMLTGLRASLPIVLIGVFGTELALTLANGIYLTIIEVKMPQRFHGRLIALNQALTWATLPIGFALLLPLAGKLNPLLARGGALADTVGRVIGTGHGRGLGLAMIIFGLLMTVNAFVALGVKRLARLDAEVPDALPDDLVGARALTASDSADAADADRPLAEARHGGH